MPTATRDLASIKSRASGTFTPIYDEDLALALKPTSAMLLWTVLNRFWSMRTPLYNPGQERPTKHTCLSKKTIERSMKVLQEDRACRFRCGREHPLVLVRWNGMGHNATVSPFTCDLISGEQGEQRKARVASQPAKKKLREEGQNDAPLFNTEASFCPLHLRQTDASLLEVGRQSGSALLGKEKLLLETSATETKTVVENFQHAETEPAIVRLIEFGVVAEKARELVSRFGSYACLEQLTAIQQRRYRRHIENPPGFLIARLENSWAVPLRSTDQSTANSSQPAPGIIDALRMRLEARSPPDAHWLKDAGVSRAVYTKAEQEVLASQQIVKSAHPHSDALEASDPAAYDVAMQRLYETLKPPFGIVAGGYRHALFFSRCRSLLERELSSICPE